MDQPVVPSRILEGQIPQAEPNASDRPEPHLRPDERELRLITDLIAQSIIVLDPDGRPLYASRPRGWIAADILRMENGRLAEHWDVLQDEASASESKSGLPMFGDRFPF
jgi:hypothetical protein